MKKSVEVTPRILELIQNNVGHAVDASKFTVYETVALTTRPLNKKGSLFDKGQHTRQTLDEMANYVVGGGNVPLHTLHQAGTEIPVGRVFYAALNDTPDGHTELRALFYILNDHVELINAMETSALDEVSVGIHHKHIYCSECDFDYLGDEATFMNFYERTCPNGHTIGSDGVYARLVGMEDWLELSLVGKGAADGAQIKPQAKRLLGDARYEQRLAAGKNPDLSILTAKTSLDTENIIGSKLNSDAKGTREMNVAEFTAELTAKATQIADLTAKLAAAEAGKTTAEAKVTSLEAELATEKTKVTDAEAKLAKTVTISDETVAYLQDISKKTRVAAGETGVDVTETDVNKLAASIKEAGAKLSNIPILGVSKETKNGAELDSQPVSNNAFKITLGK